MPTEASWKIRTAEPEDLAFVYATALKSERFASERNSLIPSAVWFEQRHREWDEVLETASVIVACDREDPTTLYGYAVIEPARGVVHFCFVKKALRRFGVCSALVGVGLENAPRQVQVATFTDPANHGYLKRALARSGHSAIWNPWSR